VLQRFGIGIDQSANGSYLPEAFHQRLHTPDYYRAVNEFMAQSTSRQEALSRLAVIRDLLMKHAYR
jgi:hypothetical protein